MDSRTVLIVDDDIGIRNTLTDLLIHEGYLAITAGTPLEALEKAEGVVPGVALLDVDLAFNDNPELVSQLHQIHPDWICALLTPDANFDTALDALKLGAYQYLRKPLEPTELLNRLRTLLDIAKLRSEKRYAEAKLRESEGWLNAILKEAVDIIYIKDEQLRYRYVNPKAAVYLGYPEEFLLGKKDNEVFSPFGAAFQAESAEQRAIAGEIVEEDVISTVGGRDTFYHLCRRPLFEEDRVCGVISIIRDTTEKQMLENKLIQAQKMEAMGVLAGGIAHDFNNILGAIVGHVDLALLGEKRGIAAEPHLVEVQKATRRASGLVKQILAFTRQNDQDVSPIQVAPIVRECIQLIRAALPTTIHIDQRINDDACVVMANPIHIHQIIMNLATNAGHAMENNRGKIMVSLQAGQGRFVDEGEVVLDGPFVEITVKDNGCGMTPATLSRIFEPLFTTKQAGRGTGLGLALVKDIVKRSGGVVEVKSLVGTGSEFRVVLPRIDATYDDVVVSESPLPRGTECILYVDDEEPLVEIGQSFFERLGYKVIGLTDPQEALNIFFKAPHRIDLVLSDQTMPDITGVELAEKIRQNRQDIPIIICSGFVESPEYKLATGLGNISFLRKPIVLREFAVTVRHVLDERKKD